MLDALVTIATALFLTNFWSKWRYGYFDAFCAGVAIAFAFATPFLTEKLAPEIANLGIFGLEAGGALLGCLIYDTASFGGR
jgi:hypothetical protein